MQYFPERLDISGLSREGMTMRGRLTYCVCTLVYQSFIDIGDGGGDSDAVAGPRLWSEQQFRYFQNGTENFVITQTLLMTILLYFVMLLYFVSYYLYSNVCTVSLYMLAILCCHTLIGMYFFRYWRLSQFILYSFHAQYICTYQ